MSFSLTSKASKNPVKTTTNCGVEKAMELSREEFVGFDWSLDVIVSVGLLVSGVHHIQWVISDVEEFRLLAIVVERVG